MVKPNEFDVVKIAQELKKVQAASPLLEELEWTDRNADIWPGAFRDEF
jgi:hypothetical protein